MKQFNIIKYLLTVTIHLTNHIVDSNLDGTEWTGASVATKRGLAGIGNNNKHSYIVVLNKQRNQSKNHKQNSLLYQRQFYTAGPKYEHWLWKAQNYKLPDHLQPESSGRSTLIFKFTWIHNNVIILLVFWYFQKSVFFMNINNVAH